MQFAYSAKSLRGEVSNGVLDAETLVAARQTLRDRGLFPLTLTPHDVASAAVTVARRGFSMRRVSKSEIMLLTSQMVIMCRAGVDLAKTLQKVSTTCRNPTLKAALEDIYRSVTEGLSLSAAMRKQTHIFGEAYVASIASGEASGNVPEVLARLQEMLKNEIKLRSTIVSALAYPVILILVCMVVISGLLFFVLPRFETVFRDMDVTPPAYTSALISFAKELQQRAWLWGLVVIGGGFVIYNFFRTEHIRRGLENMAMQLAVVGDVLQSLICGRLLVMLGTMLQSGVPLIQALQLCRAGTSSVAFRNLLDAMEEEVLNGRTISAVFTSSKVVPAGVAQMVDAAEQAGKFGSVMQLVGDYYEAEGQRKVQELAKLLEPLIIVFMGVIVAFIVASIMLPLLDISSGAGH